MTKLQLKPNSPELNRMMTNKFLFSWYAKMVMEDYELEMSRYKYLAMFTNPEAYQQVEKMSDSAYSTKNSFVSNDGNINVKLAQKLNDELNVQINEANTKAKSNKNNIDKSEGGIDIL